MWLLKLHFSISILCFLMLYGFSKVFGDMARDNGWSSVDGENTGNEIKRKSKLPGFFACFVPVLNILIVIVLFVMLFVRKKDFDNVLEELKKNSEVSNHE